MSGKISIANWDLVGLLCPGIKPLARICWLDPKKGNFAIHEGKVNLNPFSWQTSGLCWEFRDYNFSLLTVPVLHSSQSGHTLTCLKILDIGASVSYSYWRKKDDSPQSKAKNLRRFSLLHGLWKPRSRSVLLKYIRPCSNYFWRKLTKNRAVHKQGWRQLQKRCSRLVLSRSFPCTDR